ncbi:hypothetical protein CPU12_00250 [Malaciobacter molluscorum LMG 25693]|uniref:Uncharacterized protein n=1 Tax=Malaciobacter molluscorum LMG 25693 TaxID=870501 RepID=A0A2G1DL69_9BACT|nr:hypothetical protein [Malaciobacter molluscorum]AXX92015.1 hypothetical protein AMOL_1026 [Malaciobacter molluscorum LMG 25693]PHO19248.1 hypothetical protein CPU12_00250 [Malaciobacter molluscorum LMG 25693]RXJ96488.1 hypothetical protein CRV00_02415 [Malaciobacter molluscorum]
MEFIPHTQEELKSMDIKEDEIYSIQYQERDYFNADTRIEIAKGKAVISNNEIIFIVTDSYGMDKFIKEARVIK